MGFNLNEDVAARPDERGVSGGCGCELRRIVVSNHKHQELLVVEIRVLVLSR